LTDWKTYDECFSQSAAVEDCYSFHDLFLSPWMLMSDAEGQEWLEACVREKPCTRLIFKAEKPLDSTPELAHKLMKIDLQVPEVSSE
jgi:hypothetical protein